MKEQTKKVLQDLGNIGGYVTSIGSVTTLVWILYRIKKFGHTCFNEPSKPILYTEIGLLSSTIGFLGYKLIRNIYNNHK